VHMWQHPRHNQTERIDKTIRLSTVGKIQPGRHHLDIARKSICGAQTAAIVKLPILCPAKSGPITFAVAEL
jgi:hypothetical protein